MRIEVITANNGDRITYRQSLIRYLIYLLFFIEMIIMRTVVLSKLDPHQFSQLAGYDRLHYVGEHEISLPIYTSIRTIT